MVFTNILVIFLSIAVVAVNGNFQKNLFDMTEYGAVGDGRRDNGPERFFDKAEYGAVAEGRRYNGPERLFDKAEYGAVAHGRRDNGRVKFFDKDEYGAVAYRRRDDDPINFFDKAGYGAVADGRRNNGPDEFFGYDAAANGMKDDGSVKFFDVTKYGAVANGGTDNGPAFLKAWKDACAYVGKSGVRIPRGNYMVGSVTFAGPCKGPIAFVVEGTLLAPTKPNDFFTDNWIGFRYVDKLKLSGGGILDGQGKVAWPYNNCNKNKECKPLPATLKFDFVTNGEIQNLRSINSKNTHINLFACTSINISQITITAPGDSPNTDGIKIGSSSKIYISDSTIGTGDDCVAIIAGSKNIDVFRVTCGPGHGISIGSLGKSHEKEHVEGISVRNCNFKGTDNGVRIKTWAPSLPSLASDMIFENIIMNKVKNPVVIDQQYCPNSNCLKGASSAVQLQNLIFKNIRGTSQTEVAVDIKCSRSRPCRNVKLVDINLSYMNPGRKATASCTNAFGSTYGQQNPRGCL